MAQEHEAMRTSDPKITYRPFKNVEQVKNKKYMKIYPKKKITKMTSCHFDIINMLYIRCR